MLSLLSAKVLSANRYNRLRWISSTTHLSSWMDRMKGVFTGQNSATENKPFTLLRFAEEMSKARKLGSLKQFVVGKGNEASFADAFEKQEAIVRVLGGFDPNGQNIQTSQKQEAAKQCNCTVADVEDVLSKFMWAKEAQRKLEKMKEEGKPMPKSMAEVQKLMGSPPLDVPKTNLSKSEQISSKAPLMDRMKGVFTGQKSSTENDVNQSFTLLRFADEMSKARKVGSLKQYVVGRGSEATFSDAFQRQEAILRVLGGFDPTGENIQLAQKQVAAKQCNCTLADVENALSKFTWAKEAQKKVEKMKEEGKPIPKSMAEMQKLMGSTPLDVARTNMAKSGQIGRNQPCPCGSKKLYKRCCGKDKSK